MDLADKIWEKLKAAPVEEKPKVFLEYCDACIALKGKGVSEEEIGYRITNAIFYDELKHIEAIDAIFDISGQMELAREHSFVVGIPIGGTWTQEVANEVKRKEFEQLLLAVERAKREL